MLHAPPTSYSMIWSYYYLTRSTKFEALYKELFQPPVASSLSCPNVLLSTQLSNTLRPCSSLPTVRNLQLPNGQNSVVCAHWQWNGWVYHSEFFTSVQNVNRWHCLLCTILHEWPWYSLLLGLVDFVICISCKSLLKTSNSTTEIGAGLQ